MRTGKETKEKIKRIKRTEKWGQKKKRKKEREDINFLVFKKAFHRIHNEALGMMLFPPHYYLPRPGKFQYLISRRKLMKFFDSVIYDHRQNAPSEVFSFFFFFYKLLLCLSISLSSLLFFLFLFLCLGFFLVVNN